MIAMVPHMSEEIMTTTEFVGVAFPSKTRQEEEA